MNRERVIDIIRAELIRQANLKRLKIEPTGIPDDVRLLGRLDIQALAEAIANR